jgi:hypothetical protein
MSIHLLIEQSMPADYQDFYVKNKLQKSSATFRPVLHRSANNSAAEPLTFLWGHFCVLRPKYLPVGITDADFASTPNKCIILNEN